MALVVAPIDQAFTVCEWRRRKLHDRAFVLFEMLAGGWGSKCFHYKIETRTEEISVTKGVI